MTYNTFPAYIHSLVKGGRLVPYFLFQTLGIFSLVSLFSLPQSSCYLSSENIIKVNPLSYLTNCSPVSASFKLTLSFAISPPDDGGILGERLKMNQAWRGEGDLRVTGWHEESKCY